MSEVCGQLAMQWIQEDNIAKQPGKYPGGTLVLDIIIIPLVCILSWADGTS